MILYITDKVFLDSEFSLLYMYVPPFEQVFLVTSSSYHTIFYAGHTSVLSVDWPKHKAIAAISPGFSI